MDFEKELEQIAKQYRDEGYVVLTHPDGNHLPAFAGDFGVDILATRGDERVLVQVKQDRAALEADPNVPARAVITNTQPGWRYDLVLLKPDDPIRRTVRDAGEPSPEQLDQLFLEAETALQSHALRAAFVLAWAVLEAAMRRLAQRAGLNGKIGTQPLLLIRELYSSGYISQEEFRQLEQTRKLRTEIVHGLVPTAMNDDAVQYVINFAKRLLTQSTNVQEAAS